MYAYGSVLVAPRTTSHRDAEIAGYLRHEYGRGSGPGFLFAQIANAERRPHNLRDPAAAVLRAVARAVRAFASGLAYSPAVASPSAGGRQRRNPEL